MERLKNKTILIGKEPGQGRLLIALNVGGQIKSAALGMVNSVPGSVSRCKIGEGIAHCKIDIDSKGSMHVTNMKAQNVTFVNGSECISKKITEKSIVALGADMYSIDIKSILETAKKLVGVAPPPPPPEPKSIRHLEKVYDEYETALESIAYRQQERGKQRMLPMIISMSSGALSVILGLIIPGEVVYITGAITVISLVIYLNMYNEKDNSIEEKKAANNKFIDNYICPHCKHFLGNQPYKVLRQNKNCPYCKGALKE